MDNYQAEQQYIAAEREAAVQELMGDPEFNEDIRIEFVYPPIPDRRFDYQAVLDGYEPGDAIGHGQTAEAARADLVEQLAE